MIIFIFILSVFLWPVSEYFLHKHLGHKFRKNNLFYKEHTRHHIEPNYFAPIFYKLVAAIIVLFFFSLMSQLLFGNSLYTFVFLTGFLSSYLFYEYTHYSIHRFSPWTSWGVEIRKHHFIHHYENPKSNFGVTQNFFDRFFKTQVTKNGPVMVPVKFKPIWWTESKKHLIENEIEIK